MWKKSKVSWSIWSRFYFFGIWMLNWQVNVRLGINSSSYFVMLVAVTYWNQLHNFETSCREIQLIPLFNNLKKKLNFSLVSWMRKRSSSSHWSRRKRVLYVTCFLNSIFCSRTYYFTHFLLLQVSEPKSDDLSTADISRYSRQILLPSVGLEGIASFYLRILRNSFCWSLCHCYFSCRTDKIKAFICFNCRSRWFRMPCCVILGVSWRWYVQIRFTCI